MYYVACSYNKVRVKKMSLGISQGREHTVLYILKKICGGLRCPVWFILMLFMGQL